MHPLLQLSCVHPVLRWDKMSVSTPMMHFRAPGLWSGRSGGWLGGFMSRLLCTDVPVGAVGRQVEEPGPHWSPGKSWWREGSTHLKYFRSKWILCDWRKKKERTFCWISNVFYSCQMDVIMHFSILPWRDVIVPKAVVIKLMRKIEKIQNQRT